MDINGSYPAPIGRLPASSTNGTCSAHATSGDVDEDRPAVDGKTGRTKGQWPRFLLYCFRRVPEKPLKWIEELQTNL